MIYLDNSATSFPKPKGMVREMEDCIMNYCGNPGRSGHYMSILTGEKVYEVRRDVAELFNIKKPERLIFTKNTTEGLNLAIKGILRENDHVITTSMEHNSVLRPLKDMEKVGVTHTMVSGNIHGKVSIHAMEKAIRQNTKMIIITGASNVTGTLMPLKDLGNMAAKNGIIFMVDGAQLAGIREINVEKESIDILAFPGHKGLLGPLGTGGVYVKEGIDPEPVICGGTGTESKSNVQPRDLPEGFESGTVNAPAVIGLGYSVRFLKKIGIETIEFVERSLISRLDEALKNMKTVKVYGPSPSEKMGISLFNVVNTGCEEVCDQLNRYYGIAVRGGYHCAGFAHKTIGTADTGAVRVSPGPFNTRAEIDRTIDAIWKISKGN